MSLVCICGGEGERGGEEGSIFFHIDTRPLDLLREIFFLSLNKDPDAKI